MSWTGKGLNTLEIMLPALRALPDNLWFDVNDEVCQFQPATQEEVRTIRRVVGQQLSPRTQLVWNRAWDKQMKWWTYRVIVRGIHIRLFGTYEAPACCHAITAPRKTIKRIPITFEEKEVEETVIVGWKCGDDGLDKDEPDAVAPTSETAAEGGENENSTVL